MEIKIEKDVPLPGEWVKQQRDGEVEKFPLSKMEVGDSFMVDVGMELLPSQLRYAVYAASKRLGYKFATRKNHKNQIRVWRTA